MLGVCHFPTFYAGDGGDAGTSSTLGPAAVELVDRTMIELGARDPGVPRRSLDQFVRGDPDALLLVEFAGDDRAENSRRLAALDELMADLGFAGQPVVRGRSERRPLQARHLGGAQGRASTS